MKKSYVKNGKEDDVNKINDLESNLNREIFEKINESSNEQMGVCQQEELLPQPATISTTSMGKLDKVPQACNNEVDGHLLAQKTENVAPGLHNHPTTIAPKTVEKLEQPSQTGNSQLEGQINVQAETVPQKANIAPEVVYSLQQEEKELDDLCLNFETINENNIRKNIGRRGWLHSMASKVNLFVFICIAAIQPYSYIFFR